MKRKEENCHLCPFSYAVNPDIHSWPLLVFGTLSDQGKPTWNYPRVTRLSSNEFKYLQRKESLGDSEDLPGKQTKPTRRNRAQGSWWSSADPLSRDHSWALLQGEKEQWGEAALCPAGKQRSKIMQLLFPVPQWASLDAALVDNIPSCLWNHFVNAARYFPKKANNNNLKETLLTFLFRNC